MDPTPTRPRLSVDLTPEMAAELKRLIPWGIGRAVFLVLIEDLIEVLQKHGSQFLGAVLAKRVNMKETLPTLQALQGGGPDGDN